MVLGYLMSTERVIILAAEVVVHDAVLHQVVDPVPGLCHSHHHTAVLTLGSTPHRLWDLECHIIVLSVWRDCRCVHTRSLLT